MRARYFTRLSDRKEALQIIEYLSNPSDKYSLQISLIRTLAAEFGGNLTARLKIKGTRCRLAILQQGQRR